MITFFASAILYLALYCLCLSGQRNTSQACIPQKYPQVFKAAGFALLAFSIALCVADNGYGIGLSIWFGLLALCTVSLSLIVALQRRLLPLPAVVFSLIAVLV